MRIILSIAGFPDIEASQNQYTALTALIRIHAG